MAKWRVTAGSCYPGSKERCRCELYFAKGPIPRPYSGDTEVLLRITQAGYDRVRRAGAFTTGPFVVNGIRGIERLKGACGKVYRLKWR